MEKYIEQLLTDINYATQNVSVPFAEQEMDLHDWLSDEEDDKIAPVRNLEEWTGICKDQLPPHEMLSDEQVHCLLNALKKMLDAYNWSFVIQIEVPVRIQYAAIRDNFNQEAKVKRWHHGFFELCREGTEHGTCALEKYCHCAFFTEFFSGFIDEDLSPEQERARQLEIEVNHIKKKYDNDWMKYYPYHLDANYDDENGNPYDYGFGNEDEDEEDDWWRK
ncbi:MAG: hypothetical protein ABI723_11740 [Bacteroidia bacterium]